MRQLFLIAAVLIISTSIFTSCTKFYNCECVSNTGDTTTYTIDAKGKIQARTKCDEQVPLGTCDLKDKED